MPKTKKIPGQSDLVREAVSRCEDVGKLLDIGTGSGIAARAFNAAGWDVTATGFDVEDYLDDVGPFPPEITLLEDVDICDLARFDDASFDVIWCAHVLEHILDTGRALSELRRVLKPDGRLFITVPPFKHNVVGGHVSPGWNIGILMYVLAVAGFDVRTGSFVRHGYNVFADVGRGDGPLPAGTLSMANGDLEKLDALGLLPEGHSFGQGFDGNLASINWRWGNVPEELSDHQPARVSGPKEKMRIAFVVPWITTGRGGTENVGRMMANAMCDRGHDVELFTFDNQNRPPQWWLDPRIRLTRLSETDEADGDLQLFVEVGRFDPDLIVGLHMNATFRRYVRCAKRLNLPIVLSEHIDPQFPARLKTFDPALREIVMSGATRIHLLIDHFKGTLPDALRSRVRVIPNTTEPVTAFANPGACTGKRSILTVARLVPRKNIARLIWSFARIADEAPDWTLSIVGDGPEDRSLRNLSEELGIASRVEFVGHVDDVVPYYTSAHMFVLPSLFEGFPMSTLEAMAHGLPLVGYRACKGTSVQINHGINGLLSSEGGEEDSLAEDMLTLMKNDGLRAKMGHKSRERYNRLYSNKVIFDAWEAMFREAINAGENRARPSRSDYLATKLDELSWGENQLISPLKFS